MIPDRVPYLMKDVRRAEAQALFTVFSTFAGGGGSSTGYRLAGGRVIGINEFIPAATETYSKNYPETPIFSHDIRKLSGRRICSCLGVSPGELDILDGSPPCASFSMAGKREKGWGTIKKYSDTTQRVDDLFFEFCRLLGELKPKIFITENVKGLQMGIARSILGSINTSMRLGTIKRQPTILNEFLKKGYIVNWKILNSADFGVPQTRERLFIVGVREDIKIKPTFPKRSIKRWVSVKEAWKGVNEDDPDKYDFNLEQMIPFYQSQCKPGQSCSEIHPNGSYFNFGRLHPDKPSPTMLQGAGGKYYTHYSGTRHQNISEGKRIQGFPDDYILTGTLKQKWERLGRSVPPLMVARLASHLYETVIKNVRNSRGIKKY